MLINSGPSSINNTGMISKLFLRQPLRLIVKPSVFRSFAAESGKDKLSDKSDLGGQNRDKVKANEKDSLASQSKAGFGEATRVSAAPKYDKWNDNLNHLSKKMEEDKGSARWSLSKEGSKNNLYQGKARVNQGQAAGPSKYDLKQQHHLANGEDVDMHSAGRDTDNPNAEEPDIHAAGRLDVHYEGMRKRRLDNFFIPQTDRSPGSGYGDTSWSVNTDSQWTQQTIDKEIRRSVGSIRVERSRTDERSTVYRWVSKQTPAREYLRSMNDIGKGNPSKDDKLKAKK